MACVLSDDIAVVNNAAAEKREQSGDSASVQREEPFFHGSTTAGRPRQRPQASGREAVPPLRALSFWFKQDEFAPETLPPGAASCNCDRR